MYPALLDESQAITGYIDEMLDGIRNSAHGLTEEQGRSRPCRSGLSITGIIKHATWVMRQQLPADQDEGSDAEPGFAARAAEFMGSFTPAENETLARLLAAFDQIRPGYLTAIRAMDPAAEVTVGPKPWDDQPEPVQATQRMLLVHHVDEFARHAGHADIIREQIDGAQAMPLLFAVQGRAGNAFIKPWTPEQAQAD
ncbi:hypothetical protein CGZ93_06605 [Enemella dayhoffiae]|uniref:DUF664 domain-containing protein n=1 Tax=Enemella dayhoffiae TaxID=2016507 RepID=A0A255H730_9ACTN|nr:DUF664 domain-containing protein [Enemella dayhoffiae]OYO23126.1 hypothetical protein CGZ93_06605 [Enemella dayhoffiae]